MGYLNLKNCDLFSYKFELYLDGHPGFRSSFGGLMTIILCLFVILTTYGKFYKKDANNIKEFVVKLESDKKVTYSNSKKMIYVGGKYFSQEK